MNSDALDNNRSHRSLFIDALKGIAIFLVVIGHVIVAMYGEDQAEQNIIFRICYSFHMPLFVAISGFLAGGGVLLCWLGLASQKSGSIVGTLGYLDSRFLHHQI